MKLLKNQQFENQLDSLFDSFLKSFKEWVEDFEGLTLRRKKSASTKFLERQISKFTDNDLIKRLKLGK